MIPLCITVIVLALLATATIMHQRVLHQRREDRDRADMAAMEWSEPFLWQDTLHEQHWYQRGINRITGMIVMRRVPGQSDCGYIAYGISKGVDVATSIMHTGQPGVKQPT